MSTETFFEYETAAKKKKKAAKKKAATKKPTATKKPPPKKKGGDDDKVRTMAVPERPDSDDYEPPTEDIPDDD